jgi:hypothetical protein
MPGISSKFPPEQRLTFMPSQQANDPIKGIVHHPDGDLCTWVVSSQLHSLGGYIWDVLGYLDVQDQQQLETLQLVKALQLKTDMLQLALTTLTNKLEPLLEIAQSLGVTIPDWRTKDDVENGRPDMVDVLSATQAGLRTTFNVVQDGAFAPRQIIEMNPATGTFVAKGSEVVITVNDG